MKIIIVFWVIITALFLNGCSPKSYCFFDSKKGIIYLTDTSRIKSITIDTSGNNRADYFFKADSNTQIFNIKDSVELRTDTTIVIIVLTTDFRDRYKLTIQPKDWQKEKPLKFRAQVR